MKTAVVDIVAKSDAARLASALFLIDAEASGAGAGACLDPGISLPVAWFGKAEEAHLDLLIRVAIRGP